MMKVVKNLNNKKVDFSKLQIKQLDGSIVEHDFSKDLAQAIFSNTQNISEHAFSVDLFKDPIVELNDENKAIVKEYTEKYFKAFVQVAVNELIGE
ncbi:MAG: hypothetical protein PHI32_15370 [Dysgonamonadaceae bacterium]|nr:hypothetical protein [Dysgonamonadaceae bacterium]